MRVSYLERCRRVGLVASAVAVLAVALVFAQTPLTGTTGRVRARSYVFSGTGKTIPYALFVPAQYDSTKVWPLIVALHGAGQSLDGLMTYEGLLEFAERDGFILVAPLGYHEFGGFGGFFGLGQLAQTASLSHVRTDVLRDIIQKRQDLPGDIDALSEKDVMNVLEIVRGEYRVDPRRLFLWGHSMGGGGVYHLAAKYPALWAALAVAAPAPAATPAQLEQFKLLPILVLQGSADQIVRPEATRSTVAEMSRLGMQHLYVEIEGGTHTTFLSKNRDNLSKVFSFFNTVQARWISK